MARMIVAFLRKRSKRGAKCPKCNSTNTVTHDDNSMSHCFDCGHSWRGS